MIYLSGFSLDPLDSLFVANDSGKKAKEKKARESDFITQNFLI